MDKSKRRKRFQQKRRNKQRWVKRELNNLSPGIRGITGKDIDTMMWIASREANHGKLCSCSMCGNPRRHFGERTVQERRHDFT